MHTNFTVFAAVKLDGVLIVSENTCQLSQLFIVLVLIPELCFLKIKLILIEIQINVSMVGCVLLSVDLFGFGFSACKRKNWLTITVCTKLCAKTSSLEGKFAM